MSDANHTNGSANAAAEEDLCWVAEQLPSQTRFLDSVARFKGFSGPVGSGKSAALCAQAIILSHMNTGRMGMLAAPTLAMLRDASQASLREMLETQDVIFDLKKTDGELTLGAWNSVVLLRSLDEPERLRGTNLSWFGIDELSYASEDAWLRLEARLRDPKATKLCGFGVWTPQGHDWVYRRFIHRPIAGYECVRALPFENRFLLDKTPDYYERLQSSYDPRFFQQEALGEYVNSRVDRVYHCFNRAVHVVHRQYDPGKTLLWSLDFNVAPMSSVLLQYFAERLVAVDEIVISRATTEEACMEFENRYGRHASELEIYGDASGRNTHTTGGSDYAAIQNHLHRAGFRTVRIKVPPANPSVLSRVQKVNGLLTNAHGEVHLEVDERCVHLIKDFEEVLFKPATGVVDKDRDPQRTHVSDALGYAVWQLVGEKVKAGERDKRLF